MDQDSRTVKEPEGPQEGQTEEEKSHGKEDAAQELERLGAELAALQARLSEKEKEASDYYDKLLRERAELENFKKRTQREKAEALRLANETLIRDLLPAIDNLERAVEHAEGGGNGQPLVEGVKLVLRSFLDVLEKHGVSRVEAQGEMFDPARHEALAQMESSAHPPNTVVEEHHKGYFLYDRLLRPALVTIAKPPSGGNEEEEKKDGEEK